MIDVMKAVGPITKDQKNQAQGFKFRGIDQFVNALHPALANNGVFMTTDIVAKSESIKDVVRSNGKPGVDKHVALTVKYTFHAEDGSSVASTIASEGLDSGDKATNKALSAALKYALIQTFSVPTEDMAEGDLETPVLGLDKGKDHRQSQGSAADAPVIVSIQDAKLGGTPASFSGPKAPGGGNLAVQVTGAPVTGILADKVIPIIAKANDALAERANAQFVGPTDRPNPVAVPTGFRRPVKKVTEAPIVKQQTQGDDL